MPSIIAVMGSLHPLIFMEDSQIDDYVFPITPNFKGSYIRNNVLGVPKADQNVITSKVYIF